MAASDFVIVAVPLTRQTNGLIGARELGAMKLDAILVNVARGAIVDQAALYEHLRTHEAFSAAIDTWWVEGHVDGEFRVEAPFFELPNLLGSPHNSGFVAGHRRRGGRLRGGRTSVGSSRARSSRPRGSERLRFRRRAERARPIGRNCLP